MKAVAKTHRSRNGTRQAIEVLFQKLLKATKTTYRVSNIDFSLHSPDDIRVVCKDIYNCGWRLTPLHVHYDWITSLKDAKLYTLDGKLPMLVRENPSGWGTMVISVGEVLPTFKKALAELSILLGKKRELAVLAPIEGTSGIAIIADRATNGRFKATAKVVTADPGVSKFDAATAEDYLISIGFHKTRDVFVSMQLGVMVHLTAEKVSIVDTPWS